jgi:hypothetical protein
MKYVNSRDAISTKSGAIEIFLNFKSMSPDVQGVGLEELFDIITIQWEAAIKTPLWTDRAQST